MVVDDFIDEFYAFDINNWAEALENVLSMLSFPIQLEFVCDWREFLYEKSDRRLFNADDRRLLTECCEIAKLSMKGRFRKLKMFFVMLSGNKKLRNEKVYDIYKVFRKVFGEYIFFVACFERDIAFVGTSVNKFKRSEIIISDWFGEKTDREIMNRILDIDFSLFSYDNLRNLYRDYLWAIARPYIKCRESRMYLTFGCEYIETYESIVVSSDGEGIVPVTSVDRDETYRVNSAYYQKLYGDDYFIDDLGIEDETLDALENDDSELEWTMFEMELANAEIEEDDEYEEDIDDEYNSEKEDIDDVISGMNPEEMLLYIQNSGC